MEKKSNQNFTLSPLRCRTKRLTDSTDKAQMKETADNWLVKNPRGLENTKLQAFACEMLLAWRAENEWLKHVCHAGL